MTELNANEPHPAALDALHWLRTRPPVRMAQYRESLASTALSGNRLAEVCGETLRRYEAGEPVSDRYILGLVYTLRAQEFGGEHWFYKTGADGKTYAFSGVD